MKIAMIGQDIAMLLPSMLTDLLYTAKAQAEVVAEEKNPAMADLLQRYADTVMKQAGTGCTFRAESSREAVLRDCDCLIYAGDCMLSSRFHQDRVALSAPERPEGQEEEELEEDPGLTDQARVNGGIGGLLHTLRQGNVVRELCNQLKALSPDALVITLGQPVSRTVAMFSKAGFRCYGLAKSPIRGAGGLEGICGRLHAKPEQVAATVAGLPDFAWLLAMQDMEEDDDLLPVVQDAAEADDLGRLAHRWLRWYDAVPVGDVTRHAEWLPAQEDYTPDPDPRLGESVEQRKERILWMNTVAEKGLKPAIPHAQPGEGMMAQLLLLSKAPAERPVQLACAVLTGSDLTMEAVSRVNRQGAIRNLPRAAVIEARLTLAGGQEQTEGIELPQALCEICGEVDETSRLAADAAFGDRSALRECIEVDPALSGLDRLYCQQLVEALIRLNVDVLPLYDDEEDDE